MPNIPENKFLYAVMNDDVEEVCSPEILPFYFNNPRLRHHVLTKWTRANKVKLMQKLLLATNDKDLSEWVEMAKTFNYKQMQNLLEKHMSPQA